MNNRAAALKRDQETQKTAATIGSYVRRQKMQTQGAEDTVSDDSSDDFVTVWDASIGDMYVARKFRPR